MKVQRVVLSRINSAISLLKRETSVLMKYTVGFKRSDESCLYTIRPLQLQASISCAYTYVTSDAFTYIYKKYLYSV